MPRGQETNPQREDLTQHVHVKLATVELHVQETPLCTAEMTSVHDVVDGHISMCHERIVSRTGAAHSLSIRHNTLRDVCALVVVR